MKEKEISQVNLKEVAQSLIKDKDGFGDKKIEISSLGTRALDIGSIIKREDFVESDYLNVCIKTEEPSDDEIEIEEDEHIVLNDSLYIKNEEVEVKLEVPYCER